MKDKCPVCGGELFENEYKDIQCVECRGVIPFNAAAEKKITSVSLIDGHIDGE